MEGIGESEVICGMDVIAVIEAILAIEAIGAIEAICVIEGFKGLEVRGFDSMVLAAIGGVIDRLPMALREFPIGWRGRPPFVGSSTISRRLL